MSRSPGHRMNIGSYCSCPVSKITEGLRGNTATILARILLDAQAGCDCIRRTVPMP